MRFKTRELTELETQNRRGWRKKHHKNSIAADTGLPTDRYIRILPGGCEIRSLTRRILRSGVHTDPAAQFLQRIDRISHRTVCGARPPP